MTYNSKAAAFKPYILAFIFSLAFCIPLLSNAQQSVDKVVAIVGRNRIILQSELEQQFSQEKLQNPDLTDDMKCSLLQQMIMQKLLVEQSERDSVYVTDEEVEGQLDNRIRYFIHIYGSKGET